MNVSRLSRKARRDRSEETREALKYLASRDPMNRCLAFLVQQAEVRAAEMARLREHAPMKRPEEQGDKS